MNKILNERRQVWIHKNFDDLESLRGYFHGFVIRDRDSKTAIDVDKWQTPYGIIEFDNGKIDLLGLEAFHFADTQNLMAQEIWVKNNGKELWTMNNKSEDKNENTASSNNDD